MDRYLIFQKYSQDPPKIVPKLLPKQIIPEWDAFYVFGIDCGAVLAFFIILSDLLLFDINMNLCPNTQKDVCWKNCVMTHLVRTKIGEGACYNSRLVAQTFSSGAGRRHHSPSPGGGAFDDHSSSGIASTPREGQILPGHPWKKRSVWLMR